MDEREVEVSVCCAVYNHEPYIRQCLDGFVSQRTNFKFEALVHDDASTDRSAEIIREYAEKYPEIIKPIYQTENQYSRGANIYSQYLYPRARGKYLAFCEGDDYWTSPDKLQKQFDAMESRPDCVICVHKTRVWNERDQAEEPSYPRCDVPKFLTGEGFIRLKFTKGYIFQTSSYFIRKNLILEYEDERPVFQQVACIGDEPMLFWLATRGTFIYLDEVFSCYRRMVLGSWTAKRENDVKRRIEVNASARLMCLEFDKYTNGKFKKLIAPSLRYLEKRVYVDTVVYKVETRAGAACIAQIGRRRKIVLRVKAAKRKFSLQMKKLAAFVKTATRKKEARRADSTR